MSTKHRKDPFAPFVGTSKIGEISATTTQLVKAFGYPTIVNDDIPGGFRRQSLYNWLLRTEVGPITIYDYKEWEDPDFADDKVITWQIGGRGRSFKSYPIHPANAYVERVTGLPVTQTLNDLQRGIRRQEAV